MPTLDQACDLHRRGNLAEAERLYRELMALAPHQPSARIMLATLKHQQGRLEEAWSLIEPARMDDPFAWTKRGNILAAMQRDAEAEECYRRAHEMDPKFVEAVFNRAALLLGADRYAEALADFDKGLVLYPVYAEGHNNRGWCLLNLGRAPEAMASFERALAIKPDLAGAQLNRGLTYLLQGDFAAGLQIGRAHV